MKQCKEGTKALPYTFYMISEEVNQINEKFYERGNQSGRKYENTNITNILNTAGQSVESIKNYFRLTME